jgi:hypothetical protein
MRRFFLISKFYLPNFLKNFKISQFQKMTHENDEMYNAYGFI